MKNYIFITTLILSNTTWAMDKTVPYFQETTNNNNQKEAKLLNKKNGLAILDDINKYSGIREVPEIKPQSRLFISHPTHQPMMDQSSDTTIICTPNQQILDASLIKHGFEEINNDTKFSVLITNAIMTRQRLLYIIEAAVQNHNRHNNKPCSKQAIVTEVNNIRKAIETVSEQFTRNSKV
jgi:hypothetical protein